MNMNVVDTRPMAIPKFTPVNNVDILIDEDDLDKDEFFDMTLQDIHTLSYNSYT